MVDTAGEWSGVRNVRTLTDAESRTLQRAQSGIDVIKTIRSRHADARIIVLTTYPGDVQALRALKAGAMGYLQIADGCANKVVAARLDISEDTVKGHVRSILSKLNASDRTHAVTIALRRGFLEL